LGLSVELLHEEAEALDLDDLDDEDYQNGDAILEAVPALEFVGDSSPPAQVPVDDITSPLVNQVSDDSRDDASNDESEDAEEEDAASENAEEIVTGHDN
jgi:hypothetical protein